MTGDATGLLQKIWSELGIFCRQINRVQVYVTHQPSEATRTQSAGRSPIIGGPRLPPLPSLKSRHHGLETAILRPFRAGSPVDPQTQGDAARLCRYAVPWADMGLPFQGEERGIEAVSVRFQWGQRGTSMGECPADCVRVASDG